MLRPSSVRDASTCLRCNLRLVLRQIQHRRYQSSDESPQATQEFPASTSAPTFEHQQEPQPTRLRIIRHGFDAPHGSHFNHGRIRGKKGGQRRVESSESLSISSLGQDSEVIVLRDLHEPRPRRKKPDPDILKPDDVDDVDDADDARPKPPVLTGSDIENMSGRRAIRPQAQEVFESIDDLRPAGGVFSIPKDKFLAKCAALGKGYTIGQLKSYLVQKTSPARRGSSNARTSRRAFSGQEEADPTEITTRNGELQDLKRTAWHAGTTPIAKRLPAVNFSLHVGRKMNNKEDVIESILRHAWTLGIDEEEAAVGELEFLLSPMQFGLLLTKDSRTLQPLLESRKYYKDSRFQLHQADRVIRVVGPQSQAEAIARVLTESYAPAKSADIDLNTFELTLGSSLQDTLSSAQLTRIMQLTRTYVRLDVDAKRLRIASFADTAINDAHRLLVALLNTHHRRTKFTQIYDSHNTGDCRLEPVSTTKDLPSSARYLQLGRWVTSSSKQEESFADQPLPDAAKDHARNKSAERRNVNAGSTHPPLCAPSPTIDKVCETMKSHLDSPDHALDTSISIWPKRPSSDFWKARIGTSLHSVEAGTTYPGDQGIHVIDTNMPRYHQQAFTSKVPGLVGLLSSIPRSDHTKEFRGRRTRLIAHLIPSPLEQAGMMASRAYPAIQLSFYIAASSQSSLGGADVFADLPDGKRIVFQDIRAIIHTDVVQLNLPSHPADIRFERERRLVSGTATTDAGIRSFVDAIFESMKTDAVLRAPPALRIPIPQTIVTPMLKNYPLKLRQAARSLEAQAWSKQATKSGIVPVKYLFAGFEYHEPQSVDLGELAPHHMADLRSIEAGVTGGRRLDLTLLDDGPNQARHEANSTVIRGLVDASVNVINALAKSHVKEQKSRPRLTPGTLAKEPRKTAFRTEDRSTEKKSRREVRKEKFAALKISHSNSSRPKKVAEQDKVIEVDSDQDDTPRATSDEANVQETIKVENAEYQTRVFDDASVEQEHTEQTLNTEASTPISSALENNTSERTFTQATAEQTPTQATPEHRPIQVRPESQTQEVEAEEAKVPEEEPLSVRLRRMMSGGA
jgi:hypothetical protein